MKTNLCVSFSCKGWLMTLVFISAFGQMKGQIPQYSCEIRNSAFLTATDFEFDLYLAQAGSQSFELANFQIGLKLNAPFVNGGDITVTIVGGSSELNIDQQPTNTDYNSVENCIMVAPQRPPRDISGVTTGTIINSTSGVKVATFHLSNTVPFSDAPIVFDWNFAVTPYNTVVSAFLDGTPKINTIITNADQHSRSGNVMVFLEGLFDGSGNRKVQDANLGQDYFPGPVSDQLTVELMESVAPYAVVYHADHVNLYQNGNCSFTIPGSLSDSYYIIVRHRNSLFVSSSIPVAFNSNVDYSFSSSVTQAYQYFGGIDPLVQVSPGVYALYMGDVDQNGIVDIDDMGAMVSDVVIGTVAYVPADLDGLGWVDIDDMSAINPNIVAGVYAQSPEYGKSHLKLKK